MLQSATARGRFEQFTKRIARLIDLTAARARELLARIDDPAS